jgi:myosin heavy subunit
MTQIESNPRAISVRLKHYNRDKTRFQIGHDRRIGKQPDHVDLDRSSLNSSSGEMTVQDYTALMLERREMTAPKRAAQMKRVAVMTGGIITFGHLAQVGVDELTKEDQDAMFQAVAQAIAGHLENDLTGWDVHRDENAIHAHFEMPSRRGTDGKLMSEILSPAMTSELQDLAAKTAQTWVAEIERGAKKENTKARNKSVKELHQTQAIDLAKKQETLAKLERDIDTLSERIEKLNRKEALNEKERKRLETYSRRLETKEQELSDALSATKEAREQYEQRMFDRLLKRDPSAAEQVKAAQDAQRSAERAAEGAERRMREEVAEADERAAMALSERLAAVEHQERRAQIDASKAADLRSEAQRQLQEAKQDREDAVALLKANETTLEQAQGLKMLHSVEKKKVAQLEAEVSNLKVKLELISEATNKILGRLLPDWKQVKDKINQLIADRWDNHPQNPDRKKASQPRSYSSGPSGP